MILVYVEMKGVVIMKFKIGDVVELKDNLIVGQMYDGITFLEEMQEYVGKPTTVAQSDSQDCKLYLLDIDNGRFYYGEKMLESCQDKKHSYKDLLRTGIFGETNDGEVFVVVGNTLVYQNGEYDRVNSLNDELHFRSCRYICRLVENCNSFLQYKNEFLKPIFVKNVFTEKELRNYFDIETLKKLYEQETGVKIEIREGVV